MMSNNKFHKILSDTITLPLLPAKDFKETDTTYYAVLEKNYIPITSNIACIYKPDWITDYKFEKDENANEYNKLIITSISDNGTKKLRSDIMEFTVSNYMNNLMSINHIYAKVSLAPLEDIKVMLEFIPTENQKRLNKDGGVISGDELEIHIKYYAVLNGRNQSNLTLLLNGKSLDNDKIKSMKINSADNTVELVYLIDENIDSDKILKFTAKYKTQYNSSKEEKSITLKCNTYTITLSVDNLDVEFSGGNRILTYKCTYTDGISDKQKEVKDNLYLDFSYIKDQNELKYNVIKTIYDNESKEYKTTINVDKNYTFELRAISAKVVYNKKIESNTVKIIQEKPNIKLLYLVEHLESNTVDLPATNTVYYVSSFGETIRLHYYGIIDDKGTSVKITSVTNTKNNITTTYKIDAFIDNIQYNNVTLNDDLYILDITFDRNESDNFVTKIIEFKFVNLSTSCILTQKALSMKFDKNTDKSTNIIGGIPEYNNIILTFRAYDTEKNITVEDVNLYDIECDNNDVNLSDIQYEIITYKNEKGIDTPWIVAINIRCKNIYDKKEDRTLKFTVTYNNDSIKPIVYEITLKSAIYDCKIVPEANYVSGLGDDDFEITCIGITYNGLVFKNGKLDKDNDKHLESPISDLSPNKNFNPSNIITNYKNIKFSNKTKTIIGVAPLPKNEKDSTITEKDKEFSINITYQDATTTCKIKRLYLLLYIELYKDAGYSNMIENLSNLYISPFIDNKLYYKCYLCEINEDNTYSKIDLSPYLLKEFSMITLNDGKFYIEDVPSYNSEDYTYRGNIIIYRCIIPNTELYTFTYILGYNVDADDKKLSLIKKVYINKPKIQTCTVDNSSCLDATYIQYRTDKKYDPPYNDINSILYIGSKTNRISSKGLDLTLYYRVVYKIVLTPNANYIYGNDYRTYIDVDAKHFEKFFDENDITIDSSAFENAENVLLDNSTYLKIKFNVNKNDTLNERIISKHIKYLFLYDNSYNTENIFNTSTKDNNRIEIYQNGASHDISIFFDKNNSGSIEGKKITYNAYKQLNQNLHVKFLLNDELQPTYSKNFDVSNNNFKISDGVENKDLNTYQSEYNLNDFYIEPKNAKYYILYKYENGEDKIDSDILTIERTSFGQDEDCSLNAEIDKDSVSNNGDTVKITFWLTYKDKLIDLTSSAISKFIYNLEIDNDSSITLKPDNDITVTYDNNSLKYSFDYIIDANSTVNEKKYKFTIIFGGKSKGLTCTLKNSSYKLSATINPKGPLASLDPAEFTITCYIEKDTNGNVYQDVLIDNFSIELTTNKELTENESSGELQNGKYSKTYQVKTNKTPNDITYEFTCNYTLLGNTYLASISITLSGAVFDVSIYDAEEDESKQNIVSPVGETKTIKYFGILNGEHVTDLDKITFSYDNKDYMTNVSAPEKTDDYISRNISFDLNNSSEQISYTFTAKYEEKEKSITLTQTAGLFELDVSAYYIRGSQKILESEELDLNSDDSGFFYILYCAKTKDGITVDLNKEHYTVEDSKYYDGDITYEYPIGFDIIDTTVDNVNNVIVNKCSFSKNDDDSYDYERYVNFKITFYISNVEDAEVLVMQESSYSIPMLPFDYLIFKYEFLDGNLGTITKENINKYTGHDLDTITHITTKTDTLIPYENTVIDASNNVTKSMVFINNLTAGFGKTVNRADVSTYKDIILFGGDNIPGNHESVYINLKNVINAINENPDKKFLKKCRYIYIDLYGHWYGNMGTGRVKITYNTYNILGNEPNLTLNDYIYSTTVDTSVNNGDVINTVVLDKTSSPSTHYTLLGRLVYDIKHSTGSLLSKILYGYNFSNLSAPINDTTNAGYYKFDRKYKDYNINTIYMDGKYFLYTTPCVVKKIEISNTSINSNISDETVLLKPALYSTSYNLLKGRLYNEITSISINTSTTDHLIYEVADGVFTLKMKETYVNRTYNWPTTDDKTIDIVINYSPQIKINDTDYMKLIIRVIEKKYKETT